MPDHDLNDLIMEDMPPINRDLVDGLAFAEIEHAEEFLISTCRSAEKDFPPGLEFVELRRLKHWEEYLFNTRRGGGQATLEIARTDTYIVALIFKWQGQELQPCHVALPIVEDGGIMHIRGSKYSIAPVIADVAFSVGSNYVFLPLGRDKITFYREIHHIRVDGDAHATFIPWSNIHHEMKKVAKNSSTRLRTTLQHYLFARFGVTKTFERYTGAHVKIGTEQTINRIHYAKEDWVLLASIKPMPNRARQRNYTPTDVVIAVPRQEYNERVEAMAAGFFYVADHLPHRITAEDADETYLWSVTMGLSIFGSGLSEGQIAKKMEDHLNSLDTHVVEADRKMLRSAGVEIEDVYDLFVYLIDHMPKMMVDAHENLSSMYNKRLKVLPYVMKDLTNAINRFMYRVKANAKKPLTAKDIQEKLAENIGVNTILGINKDHGEVDTSVSSPGDNKYFKITSRGVKQVNSSGPKQRTISLTDPANFLHASIAECGSYLTPNGSSPTGHERLNPCLHLSEDRVVVRNETLRELLDDVQRRIRR